MHLGHWIFVLRLLKEFEADKRPLTARELLNHTRELTLEDLQRTLRSLHSHGLATETGPASNRAYSLTAVGKDAINSYEAFRL